MPRIIAAQKETRQRRVSSVNVIGCLRGLIDAEFLFGFDHHFNHYFHFRRVFPGHFAPFGTIEFQYFFSHGNLQFSCISNL
ncbi:hypothetical protein, partial [Thiolapillus sp.]|uniref:hypothetical protein n=1 Tax=Thiolapillus sp. TaxID=2017437 RepID=UPI003AF9F637